MEAGQRMDTVIWPSSSSRRCGTGAGAGTGAGTAGSTGDSVLSSDVMRASSSIAVGEPARVPVTRGRLARSSGARGSVEDPDGTAAGIRGANSMVMPEPATRSAEPSAAATSTPYPVSSGNTSATELSANATGSLRARALATTARTTSPTTSGTPLTSRSTALGSNSSAQSSRTGCTDPRPTGGLPTEPTAAESSPAASLPVAPWSARRRPARFRPGTVFSAPLPAASRSNVVSAWRSRDRRSTCEPTASVTAPVGPSITATGTENRSRRRAIPGGVDRRSVLRSALSTPGRPARVSGLRARP